MGKNGDRLTTPRVAQAKGVELTGSGFYEASMKETSAVLQELNTSLKGLTKNTVDEMRGLYGDNMVTYGKKKSLLQEIYEAFVNPFTAILFGLAIVSFITDVLLAEPGDKDLTTVIIITTMIMIAGALRFIQETRGGNAAERLSQMIKTTTAVERQGIGRKEILLEDVVVGDIVYLAAGDIVPADVRILKSKDLFVNQSPLTGESEPVEKSPSIVKQGEYDTATEYHNLAFMGSTVVIGSATCVVIATGDNTFFGTIAKGLTAKPVQTSFEKGVNSVSWVLISFMLVMVPVVLFINGFTKGNWLEALLFAVSVAVGLTPEMLPTIVTTALAKGAVAMSRKKTIIKSLNAIQNLGSMNVLCTDKTGTLTLDKVVLLYHLDVHGNEDVRVLRHAFLNSYYQTGLKNLMDVSIIEHTTRESANENTLQGLSTNYDKVDEVPFDFQRRRMSVVVEDKKGKTQMVTKGAVEEMLSISNYVEYKGKVEPMTDAIKQDILVTVDNLNDQGMRVIAVAQKTNPSPVGVFSVKDEADMVLMGYLAFLDPPKETTAPAIAALQDHGVAVKILTGDNDRVTRSICKQVGLKVDNLLLGPDIERMSKDELRSAIEITNVFAKLSPQQKATIVSMLRENGHVVGYLGDGINDAAAMEASDVGVSVDTAVDIAKESAQVILLEKDLMVLENGVIEGRKTYANMIKYIKMTASSNFGNVFSVLVASAFLPFLPMAAIHLVLLNLIYDISSTAIPWDNVDKEFLKEPQKWDPSSISKFMIWIGPTSSVFDITTYGLMYFIICPLMTGGLLFHEINNPLMQTYYIALFQAGWFVESMWSQTLVIHMLRTPKIPFIQSRASISVVVLTFTGIAVLTAIPYTSLGASIGLAALPAVYFAWLALTIIGYMALVTVFKSIYINRYGKLL
ncbi:MAG: magnesium-translocating P-type ATPase [Dethiobacteria bacterium]|jgi:Mg2+-importing ATPase